MSTTITVRNTGAGYTPFYLVYGRQSNVPSNQKFNNNRISYNLHNYVELLKAKLTIAHKEVRDRLLNRKSETKTKYDVNCERKKFHEGDKVLGNDQNLAACDIAACPAKKLEPKYLGPYDIISDSNENVKIKHKRKIRYST